MNKKTIIFDLDDTAGNLKVRLQDIYRRATGNNEILYTDWIDYNAKDRYGITSDQLSQLFIDDQSLQLMEPHDGLVEVTQELRDRGYNIEFVTARAWHPHAEEITHEWLARHRVVHDKVNIVPLFECKEEVTRHIENIHLFIDDRYDHCKRMLESGRIGTALLYAQPWNERLHNTFTMPGEKLVRIEQLTDVLQYA